MPNINIVQTNQLTKIIGGKELVKDVNIHVKKGEIYGFVGPNGAGKTTVMKILTNLWKPTAGTVELFGQTLTPTSYEVLKRMGSIIEFPCFFVYVDVMDKGKGIEKQFAASVFERLYTMEDSRNRSIQGNGTMQSTHSGHWYPLP